MLGPCDHGRRRAARAREDDDGCRDHGRAVAAYVGQRHGSEVMSRIAAPMVGGRLPRLSEVVIPAIYALVKTWELQRAAPPPEEQGRRVAGVPTKASEPDGADYEVVIRA